MKEPVETNVQSLIAKWQLDTAPKIKRERDLIRVDVTVEELHKTEKLDADETFIGTKVIDVNIKRELPRIFSFLTESSRFLVFKGLDAPEAKESEEWYARECRVGQWTVPHLQTYYAAATHGVAFCEIIGDKTSIIGTRVEYVPNEELVYNKATKDIQTQGLIARIFVIPVSYLRTFGAPLGFDPAVMEEIENSYSDNIWEKTTTLYKVFYRGEGNNVYCRWFHLEKIKFLTVPVLHASGAYDADNNAVPTTRYPFIPMRYTMTADTMYGDMQGRAAYDEPLQEAIQGLQSAYVNGAMRASGFYPYIDESGTSDGSSVGQLRGAALQHNRVADKKLAVFQPSWPSADMLQAVQLFKTTVSNDAGQTDFATVTKRMTNTTATEIAASSEQARLLSSVGVSLMAMYMFAVESYRFEIFRSNLAGQVGAPPEIVARLAAITPVSVADEQFRSRDQKLSAAKDWLGKLVNTPAFVPLMISILHEDLPQYAALIEHSMPDTKPVGAAMLALLEEVGKHSPEITQDPNYAKIIAAATAAFGGAPTVAAPTANAGAPTASPQAG